MFLSAILHVHLFLARLGRALAPRLDGSPGRDRGQSTAEYALVLLGATTVAIVFFKWAGGTNRITKLFDEVLDTVIGKV